MSSYEKLLQRLLSKPKDFTYSEMKTLLSRLGYKEDTKGRTSGSRVEFINESTGKAIEVHKPHPKPVLKIYMINRIIKKLKEYGEINENNGL